MVKSIVFSFCGARAERGARPPHLSYADYRQLHKHTQQDSSERGITSSRRLPLLSQHTTNTTCPQRDSNRRSQQSRDLRPTRTFRPQDHRDRLGWSKTGFLIYCVLTRKSELFLCFACYFSR